MEPLPITLTQARHSWLLRQHLARPRQKPRNVVDRVAEVGWIAMPSPITPYLALFARGAITRRSELDAHLGELSVVPGPKGSTWLVPQADAPYARAFAVADHASREARIASATTLPARDLAAIHDLLRTHLAQPVSLDELRARLPDWAMRSLGVPGRKTGIATVAALVLRSMWINGEVQRTTREGRLDQGPTIWSIDPRPRVVPSATEALAHVAGRWLDANSPVSARTFATTFGTPAGRALPALRAAKPIEVRIEDSDEMFLAPGQFVPPERADAGAVLVPARDPITEIHLSMLSSPDGVRTATTRAGTSAPCVLIDGEIVATWGFDATAGEVISTPVDRLLEPHESVAIANEAKLLTAFIRSELSSVPMHTVTTPGTGRSRAVTGPSNDLAIEL